MREYEYSSCAFCTKCGNNSVCGFTKAEVYNGGAVFKQYQDYRCTGYKTHKFPKQNKKYTTR